MMFLSLDEAQKAEFREAVFKYKYSSPTLSLFERLYLERFWDSVVHLYPRWLAPNVITLAGYVCVLFAFFITLEGSPEFKAELPGWKYVLNGALFFIYQTLDGSDGKQARRTGSGSALGELMDHGVDAVVTAFLALLTSDVFGFGILSLWPWCFVLVAHLNFFMSNMTLVHSGRQMFFTLDVMEVQTVMIVTLLIAGFGGVNALNSINFPIPDFAKAFHFDLFGLVSKDQAIDLSDGRISIGEIGTIGGLTGCAFNFPQYVFASIRPYILSSVEYQPKHVKDRVTGTGLKALCFHLALLSMFTVLAVSCIFGGIQMKVAHHVKCSVMQALALVISFGFADLMDRILIMRVARRPLNYVPFGFIPLAFFAIATWSSWQAGFPWWWIAAAVSWIGHHIYFLMAVKHIADALEIHPLRITKTASK